ncbi:MAG: RpiB/LacA/LacB family sugar-phosphate isomerase [Candidatus Shapirobacteria bacterium]|jgi:ribose 5-phosphate isomerase B
MIYLGADHRGYNLKEAIKSWLRSENYEVTDMGDDKYDKEDDYVDYAIKVGERVVAEKAKGVLICGSGVGMTMAVNKVNGIRASVLTSVEQARVAREEDDINVACLTADLVPIEQNQEIIRVFLETVFSSEERHINRIQKIKKYESEKCCQT